MEKKLKIMVVDDDPDFMDFTRKVLEKEGYEVSVAPGEEEALELVDSEAPDLMLLDVMMARLDSGFQLLWKLKAHDRLKQIPVIIVTAIDKKTKFNFATHALKAKQTPEEKAFLPVAGYFVKPVEATELVSKISKALESAQK